MPVPILLFEVSHRRLGLKLECVREVLRSAALTPPVMEGDRLEGFLNLRGQTVPIVDLRSLLGLKTRSNAPEDVLVIAQTGQASWGIRVDRGVQIHQAEAHDLEPSAHHRLLAESLRVDEQIAFLIDPQQIGALVSAVDTESSSAGGPRE